MLNKLQNRYLRQTFALIIHDEAVQTFEDKLLELAPHLAEISGVGRLLMGTLAVIIQNLDDNDLAQKTAQVFISRYDLRTEDLQNIRQAFCWTLDQSLEHELGLNIKTAWQDFFEILLPPTS